MTEQESIKARIYRNEIDLDTLSGKVTHQKEITIAGQNLEEVKKVFDEEWRK